MVVGVCEGGYSIIDSIIGYSIIKYSIIGYYIPVLVCSPAASSYYSSAYSSPSAAPLQTLVWYVVCGM
jgi:hypothetical protein